MAHKNEDTIRELYAAFAEGDMETVLGLCDDGIVFHVPGKASFSGDHTKADFGVWIGEVMRLCHGTFQEDVLDVLVSDDHVLVVLDHHFVVDGEPRQYFTSHLWTVKDGRFTEFRELPDDQDEFTAAWS
jgi:ketosteroid isomerase-like protein